MGYSKISWVCLDWIVDACASYVSGHNILKRDFALGLEWYGAVAEIDALGGEGSRNSHERARDWSMLASVYITGFSIHLYFYLFKLVD